MDSPCRHSMDSVDSLHGVPRDSPQTLSMDSPVDSTDSPGGLSMYSPCTLCGLSMDSVDSLLNASMHSPCGLSQQTFFADSLCRPSMDSSCRLSPCSLPVDSPMESQQTLCRLSLDSPCRVSPWSLPVDSPMDSPHRFSPRTLSVDIFRLFCGFSANSFSLDFPQELSLWTHRLSGFSPRNLSVNSPQILLWTLYGLSP